MPMDIEIFTGGCHLCEETVSMVKSVMGPMCSLRIYNLVKNEGREMAENYGVTAVPTIIGNGQKMFEGKPKHSELLQCSMEHGCKGRLLK